MYWKMSRRERVGMVTNFKGRTYEEKLAEAGMVTLEERRRRGDLVQAFRVFNGVDNVDPDIWFTTVEAREGATATRQARGYMNVTRADGRSLDIRRNFWSQRVTGPWNNLPNEVKEAKTLNNFKNGLDNYNTKVRRGQR